MFTLLRGLIYFWQNKSLFLLPAFGVPFLVAVWLFSQPQVFVASATLQIAPEIRSMPTFSQYFGQYSPHALSNLVSHPALLMKSANRTGYPVESGRFQLVATSPLSFGITYKSPIETGLAEMVDEHLLTVVGAIIAPERLRNANELHEAEKNIHNLTLDLAATTATLTALKKPASKSEEALNTYRSKHAQLTLKKDRLATQLRLSRTTYEDKLAATQQMRPQLAKSGFSHLIWLAQPAAISTKRPPNEMFFELLPVLIALGVGFGLILVASKRFASSALYSNLEVSKRTGLRVLGRIPSFGPLVWQAGQWHRSKLPNVLPTDYTELTRLQQTLMGGRSGSLCVVGTQAGEGNSMLAYLLANRSAQDGKHVLLIDLNLKNHALTNRIDQKPQQWDLPHKTQLASVAELAIQTIPNLYVLPAPADADSVKWLGEMTNVEFLLGALKQKFDWVIIDTTPLTIRNRHNVDPTLLAAVADYGVVSLMAGVTSKVKFTLAMRDLIGSGAKISGVAVNDFKNPSIKDSLQSLANAVRPVLPGFASWIGYRLRG